MRVFILATCRDESLLPFTKLVFGSLRTGFPTADVEVHGNALNGKALAEVQDSCVTAGAKFSNEPATIHHEWLDGLLSSQSDPFVLCDTDMIFYEPVEWSFATPLAGWRIPEFNDEFTGARTRARLHTSLLFIDPAGVWAALERYFEQFARTVFNPFPNLIHPQCAPFKGGAHFYDTAAMLYHAIGGTAFNDRQLEAYHHLNFGTIPDVVLPRLSQAPEMLRARAAILKNPVLGKGQWRTQMKYYEARQ